MPLRSLSGAADTDSSTAWHELLPARLTRRGSGRGRRRSSSGGDQPTAEKHDVAPFPSWLNAQLVDLGDTDAEAARLASYRGSTWRSHTSEDGITAAGLGAHAFESQKGQAVWELFTSECSHLATLNVVCDLFQRMLRLVCLSKDVRMANPLNRFLGVDAWWLGCACGEE